MKYLPKILLVYSAVFSTFILVLGLVTSRDSSMFLMQLLFLPVVIYFTWEYLSRRKEAAIALSSTSLTISVIIFAALIVTSIVFVNDSKLENEFLTDIPADNPLIINSKEKTTYKPQSFVYVNLEDNNSYVNFRLSPDLISEVIDIGVAGERFLFLEEQRDWYKIELDDGKAAYVFKKYVTLQTPE